jgi:hypothetical protein
LHSWDQEHPMAPDLAGAIALAGIDPSLESHPLQERDK